MVTPRREVPKYEIGERIARGAESILCIATHRQSRYCVKTVRNWLGKLVSPSNIKSGEEKLDVPYRSKVRHLRNEFAVGQKLLKSGDIPIVRMYALKRIKPFFYELGYDLLMEYIDGDDLGDVRAMRMLSFADKLNYFYQTCLALRFVHHNGYLHLDIKPSNIMVTKGVVKLIDFGVSVPLGEKLRSIAGTAGFLSPEQLVCGYVNEATDVFMLGVTFNVVFGGRPLHQVHDELQDRLTRMEAKFHMATLGKPLVPEIPELRDTPELQDVVRRCTVPRREKRVSSLKTVMDALRRTAADLDIKLDEP